MTKRTPPTPQKIDVHAEITQTIIDALEAGKKTGDRWKKPWFDGLTVGNMFNYSNPFSGTRYSFLNALLLSLHANKTNLSGTFWATFKQWQAVPGASVIKGSKGAMVYFYTQVKRETVNPDTRETEIDSFPVLKRYYLFNIDQIKFEDDAARMEFIAKHTEKAVQPLANPHERIDTLETWIANIPGLVLNQSEKVFKPACYSPSVDTITMPCFTLFKSAGDYYMTILHELIHWTGHKSRLDRWTGLQSDKATYAFEELIAELGSVMLSHSLGIMPSDLSNHACYVNSWLQALRDDKKFIFKASKKASLAAEYMLEITQEDTTETTSAQAKKRGQ